MYGNKNPGLADRILYWQQDPNDGCWILHLISVSSLFLYND
ncbi:hypothetical protein D1BOALGB6SA_6672 [Olavius sp. associated proteobacterium Delta 1]|nr:hypothetical protein D1BOALGB6SA_6672 [Olavius sp. associated proteobacterium Delta 1]